ncbi:MAG TPA: hypothetical protein VGE08_13700 [Steroidobacter sp.]|uniref:hypothetical protein n=1 Tax=Steroidobacter sp. TaxID=1978227 RepID=UPI002ED7F359
MSATAPIDRNTVQDTSSADVARPRGSALALIGKCLLLGLATVATVLALFLFVPEGNDYAEATLLKHGRLAALPGPRIILVGGSNLAFGIDSTIIERNTGCRVVNMGMNGYLGVQYMLSEVRPFLHRNDIVVVALEYDNYHKAIGGTPSDQLMIVKANPAAFTYLDADQRKAVLSTIPYVAQQKMLRLMRDGLGNAWLRLFNPEGGKGPNISEIESLAGFTEHGDLISHLNVDWPGHREDGIDMTGTPRDPQVIPLLQQFTSDVRAEGVNVLISYTPVIDSFYRRHQRSIDGLYEELKHAPQLTVPSPPTAFVYGEDLFFDTVYHLNAAGRVLRSERLARDIVGQFDTRTICAGQHMTTTEASE